MKKHLILSIIALWASLQASEFSGWSFGGHLGTTIGTFRSSENIGAGTGTKGDLSAEGLILGPDLMWGEILPNYFYGYGANASFETTSGGVSATGADEKISRKANLGADFRMGKIFSSTLAYGLVGIRLGNLKAESREGGSSVKHKKLALTIGLGARVLLNHTNYMGFQWTRDFYNSLSPIGLKVKNPKIDALVLTYGWTFEKILFKRY